ncbi:MAG: mechanosensitive ion channel family protein [Selenomonadaceae bacterium]|nr:mechanosensitive ion channel family protein [Selenomonadaceae bacterium]
MLVPGCILIAAIIIGVALNKAIKRRIENHLQIEETSLTYVFIKALQGVPVSFCMVAGLYWIINTIDIPPGVSKLFSYILFTVNVFTLTRVIAQALSAFVDFQMARSEGKLPKSTLLNSILNFVIYAVGIIIILQYYGISVAPIITAMGVGGMAIALGLQETMANIFSGLQLIVFKQLRLDDYIKLNSGEEGRVTDINWRYTTIQSILGNVIVIPNKTIAAAIITNYNLPYRDYTIKIPIGVDYDSDLQHVEDVTLDVARQVTATVMADSPLDFEHDVEPKVLFRTFADSAIEFDVLLHSARFDKQAALKHAFIKELTARYRKEKINIPFPIRTVVQPEK